MELTTNKRLYANGCNLNETKRENSLNFTGVSELIGFLLNGEMEHSTSIRFVNVEDFETYLDALDADYDIEYVFF